MKVSDTVMSKTEIREALVKSGCPEPLIKKICEDLLFWWKIGWLQEILLAQKQAGIKEVVEWGNQPCDIKEHQIIGQVKGLVFYGHPLLKRNCEKCYQSKLKELGMLLNIKNL